MSVLKDKTAMNRVGEELRQTREALGLSPRDIRDKTRISLDMIEAMESGDFSRFPGKVYARAFLRDYARALGIDEGPLLAEMDSDEIPVQIPCIEQDEIKGLSLGRYFPVVAWALTATVCLVVAMGIVQLTKPRVEPWQYQSLKQRIPDQPKPYDASAAESESLPLPTNVEISETTESAPMKNGTSLKLRTEAEAWIRVRSERKVLFVGTLPSGTTRQFRSSEPIEIRVGNAGAVFVSQDGSAERRLGSSGQVLSRVFSPSD